MQEDNLTQLFIDANVTHTNGELLTVVGISRSAVDHEIYRNGKSENTSSTDISAFAWDQTTSWTFGRDYRHEFLEFEPAAAVTALVGVAARTAWRPEHIAQWHRDPFGPFRQQRRVSYFVAPAVVAGLIGPQPGSLAQIGVGR